ncbi:(2Fe-2S)-binding protein [Kineosporia succinea]|uniref:Molibdopterin-dependent oxidoreductase YjgC n=1 Tax=Kineosporia succinea TaxID=84632 RepID=A0ABT9PB52_9ACTN|nr:(2Fe-2S)-binding protein [Kineosporia succinea]MDP9829756.1 putative molibdopterin-dependent oxidoreductase YjgC [Kineosporia succinea]
MRITVDGTPHEVEAGISVTAALRTLDVKAVRRHLVTSEPRGPWCGMGTCFECLVEIDGQPGTRACLTAVRDGLDVRTTP